MQTKYSKQWGHMAPYYGTSLESEAVAMQEAERILRKFEKRGKPGNGPGTLYASVYDDGEHAGRFRYRPVVGPNDVRI